MTRSDAKEDQRQDPRPDQRRFRLGVRNRLWTLAKGQFGGLLWRALLYAVPILGLGAYTAALNNFVNKYVTLQNGEWIIEKGKDIASLGNNPTLQGGVPTGLNDFLLRYAYQKPIVQIGLMATLVVLVELLLFRRRRRNSIPHRS